MNSRHPQTPFFFSGIRLRLARVAPSLQPLSAPAAVRPPPSLRALLPPHTTTTANTARMGPAGTLLPPTDVHRTAPLGPRPTPSGPPRRRQGQHVVAAMALEQQTTAGAQELVGAVMSAAQKSRMQSTARKSKVASPSISQPAPPPLCIPLVAMAVPNESFLGARENVHNLFETRF